MLVQTIRSDFKQKYSSVLDDNTVSDYIYHLNAQTPRWGTCYYPQRSDRSMLRASPVFLHQRRDGLQEHDHPLWLGKEAHAGADPPGPSPHPHLLHLRVPVQHRQQVGMCT